MRARKPFTLLLAVTSTLAVLSSLEDLAAAWAPDEVAATTAVPASGDTVATTAFAVG